MLRTVFVAAAFLYALNCHAADMPIAEDAHSHPSLRRSAITLAAVVDQASAWLPDHAAFSADAMLAESERRQARSPIAESAALGLNYQSDRHRDRIGLDQQEVSIRLPLWNWGERSATQAWAQARGIETARLQQQFRWQVAGQVREVLWNIALAEQSLTAAQEQQQLLEKLLQQTQRQLQAGDVARFDALLVEQELADVRQQALAAEADLRDAERNYTALTGLTDLPANFVEAGSGKAELTLDHPALIAAAAQVEVAQRAVDAMRYQTDTRPTLSLNLKRERPEQFAPITDSAGVAIEWPIDIGGRHPVRNASANLALTRAQVARQKLLRELEAQLHEVQHQLAVFRERFVEAQRGNALAEQQWQMQQQAFRSGEIGLQELLLTERRYFSARSRHQQLQIEQGRLIARFNQIVGELP